MWNVSSEVTREENQIEYSFGIASSELQTAASLNSTSTNRQSAAISKILFASTVLNDGRT